MNESFPINSTILYEYYTFEPIKIYFYTVNVLHDM